MPKSTSFRSDILKAILQAVFTNLTNIIANGASPITDIYLSLHTADPSGGDQSTSEVSYTGYARKAVLRTAAGWSVSGNVATPLVDVVFGTCTAGSATATHVGIGKSISGVGYLFWSGTLSPNIAIASTVIPTIPAGSTITET